MSEHRIEFGELTPRGLIRRGTVAQSAVMDCPHLILGIEHYRLDGSCRCDDPVEQRRLIEQWGYAPEDFPSPPSPPQGSSPGGSDNPSSDPPPLLKTEVHE